MTKYQDANALKDFYSKEIERARDDYNDAKNSSDKNKAEERESHYQQQYDRVNTTDKNQKNWKR